MPSFYSLNVFVFLNLLNLPLGVGESQLLGALLVPFEFLDLFLYEDLPVEPEKKKG